MSMASPVITPLVEFVESAAKQSYRRPLRAIASAMRADAKENFRHERDPNDNPWKPLKNPKRQRAVRRVKAKILRDTDRMFRSVTVKGAEGSIERVTDRTLSWGTDVPYAGYHQFGTKRIPRRAFIGAGKRLQDRIAAIVAEHVEDLAAGLWG